jgi:hypothetical protein
MEAQRFLSNLAPKNDERIQKPTYTAMFQPLPANLHLLQAHLLELVTCDN